MLSEPKRQVGFYLDSGWPGDNYEVTIAMALALVSRGWRYGRDLLYLCFPHAAHDEKAWGMRLHLPMQLLTGIVARASHSADPLLQNPPNSQCVGSDDYAGYMRARHVKPKKIVFHSRLLPHETCRVNRVQHLKTKKGFLVFSDSGFMTYQPQT